MIKKNRYFKRRFNNKLVGRYKGSTPLQAAKKAFTNMKVDFGSFSIVEITQNSKRNEYHYVGHKKKLEYPISYKIGNNEYITKRYKINVRRLNIKN